MDARAVTRPGRLDESLLQIVIDSLDGRLFIVGGTGTILGTNRLWDDDCRRLGWPAQLAGPGADALEFIDTLPGEFGRELGEAVREVITTADSYRVVKGRWPTRDDEEFVVVRVHPMRDHAHARAVVIVVDITASMQTQEKLRRLSDEARLLALVAKHTDSAVLIAGMDDRLEWANDAFHAMTGLTREQLTTVPGSALYEQLLFDKPPMAELVHELAAGRTIDTECRLRDRAGTTRWVHLELKRISDQGQPERVIVVMRDVTKRRAAEDQALRLAGALQAEKSVLASIVETIPHLVYRKDATLRYAHVNRAYLALRRLEEAQVIGRTEAQLAIGDALSQALAAAEGEVLGTGLAVIDQRVNLPSPDGDRVLLVSVLPHRVNPGPDGAHDVQGIIGVAADVTRVTELERQLAQASRLESIGLLAAGIAHEINTPIQFVTDNTRFLADSYAGLLPALQEIGRRSGPAPGTADLADAVADLDLDFIAAEVPSAITQSLEGLSRVSEIVRAMKDFSHPGVERTDTDLNRIIESTVQVSRGEWKYVAEVELGLDPGVGAVPCYEGELKQVLLNIVVNAAQALGDQRKDDDSLPMGHIWITSHRDHGAGTVRIDIRDDGPGMTKEVRDRVFDQFFTTKEVGRGTGQGLSIARQVVLKHQGTIDVTSAPGQGTTFTIVLPATVPATVPADV